MHPSVRRGRLNVMANCLGPVLTDRTSGVKAVLVRRIARMVCERVAPAEAVSGCSAPIMGGIKRHSLIVALRRGGKTAPDVATGSRRMKDVRMWMRAAMDPPGLRRKWIAGVVPTDLKWTVVAERNVRDLAGRAGDRE